MNNPPKTIYYCYIGRYSFPFSELWVAATSPVLFVRITAGEPDASYITIQDYLGGNYDKPN